MRETAKRINFGIIYGMSAFGLAKDLNISQEEAQNFIDAYFMRYPKVKEFLERQIKLARSQLFVATLMGRRRYIPNIDSKNNNLRQFAERQAVNAPVQGSAADLIKLAMINIHRELNNKGFQARMVLQVHDELVFDVPKKEITQLQELVKDQMEDVLKLDVPIKVDIKVGENWLEIREVK
jgi:DNA polymerase-1